MTTDVRPDRRESLDEMIDRVAVTMTAVPNDAAFATRLAGRLPARRASWLEPRGMIVAALAGAVVVLAVGLTIRRAEPRVIPDARVARGAGAPAASVGPASQTPITVDAAVAPASPRTTPSRVRPRRTYISHDHIVPQIAALEAPAALGVDDADPMFLTIKPVELAPLDLANLTFSDLDSPDHPKE